MRPKLIRIVKVCIYEMSPYRAGLKDVPVYNVDEELYAYEGNRMELLILVRMEIICKRLCSHFR